MDLGLYSLFYKQLAPERNYIR